MDRRFEGKTAVITGGASGIGRCTALAFAAEGANVVIVTSTAVDRAAAVAQECAEKHGVGALPVKCDVRVEADVEAMIQAALERFGKIDIAFNNAGVGPDGVTIPMVPLHELSERDWDWVSDVDLKGAFLCMKHEIRAMRGSGGGSIVCTASTAGLKPLGNFGAYGPAKAALIMLTKEAAVENVDFGIRCNAVCPGATSGTGMFERLFGRRNDAEARRIPYGKPENISDAVLWLCSDEAKRLTGNVLSIDGGVDIV